MLHHMMISKELTDVTLVSEDKKHFKAHKIVLSASSTIFKNIIDENYNSNPVIYLRGIQSYEVESILQFIYLGQVKFDQKRMNEFLNVGKSLEIKEICKDNEFPGNEPSDDDEIYELEEEKDLSALKPNPQQLSEINTTKEEPFNSSTRNIAQDNSELMCNECGKQFSYKAGLYTHKKSIHEGLKYPCDHCNYIATRKDSLKRHINSSHPGVKY